MMKNMMMMMMMMTMTMTMMTMTMMTMMAMMAMMTMMTMMTIMMMMVMLMMVMMMMVMVLVLLVVVHSTYSTHRLLSCALQDESHDYGHVHFVPQTQCFLMFGHVVDVGAGKSLPVHVLLISITRRYCFMKFVSTEHVFFWPLST